ncbi:glycosyltransferase [Olivibacter sp. CPCC 100613]|uniref:glycosyltransferase n=1 Tax=Olivibacter sp. CPCC 100613 TaxID=3079931 RepID=UPI002FF6B9CD
MVLKNVALLNPLVPHYREEFFKQLASHVNLDIYVYENGSEYANFKVSELQVKNIKNFGFLGNRFIFYSIFPLLTKKYDTLVLMLHFGHISAWFLLLTQVFHRKKVILWGQGISVKRYLQEQKKPNLLFRWMIGLSHGVWLYTEEEQKQWKKIFPGKSIVALNNTISGVEDVLATDYTADERRGLKEKHRIQQEICFIYCARFDNPYRRFDLLIQTIELLEPQRYGFIIIGDGIHKPDFKAYPNVYDYGKVYEKQLKDELFSIADLYYQPGWIGLSVVEAMAYGKPILTFRRSDQILQCVEYSYIQDRRNGILLNDLEELKQSLSHMVRNDMDEMGRASKQIVKSKLLMRNMTENALSIL